MQRTYKFRLHPNKEQEQALHHTLDNCRFLYNLLLEGLSNQSKLNRLELQNSIPQLKEKFTWLKDSYSKTLQYESYRLFSNLKSLSQLKKNGKKVGKLRIKGKGWFKTFTYNQSGFKIIETNTGLDKLHLSKIGDIPIRLHRKIKGKIKQIVVKKYPSGKWYASVCAETDNPMPINYTPKKPVGIDVGIKYFLTDSDGHQIENPHNLKKGLDKLKKVQQNLSRKKKGSSNRNKARVKVARIHEKVVNQRNDFLHKLSRYYVNQYDLIAIEDLKIKNMVRNHYLS
jgi:putative transposase